VKTKSACLKFLHLLHLLHSCPNQHSFPVLLIFPYNAFCYLSLASESAATAFTPKSDLSSMYVKNERKAPRQVILHLILVILFSCQIKR
jgi:hypothetical protein